MNGPEVAKKIVRAVSSTLDKIAGGIARSIIEGQPRYPKQIDRGEQAVERLDAIIAARNKNTQQIAEILAPENTGRKNRKGIFN